MAASQNNNFTSIGTINKGSVVKSRNLNSEKLASSRVFYNTIVANSGSFDNRVMGNGPICNEDLVDILVLPPTSAITNDDAMKNMMEKTEFKK